MKKINLFILTLSALCFCACDSNKGKVKELAIQFVNAVNDKDKVTIYNIYPNAKNITNMKLPEMIADGDISVEKDDIGMYIVSIANSRQQKFEFDVKGENEIVLVDSHSFMELDSAAMEIAIKTGIPLKKKSDLYISKLLDQEGEYIEYLNKMYSDAIKGHLVRESGTYTASHAFGGSVSVTQPIRNIGDVPIKGSEYNVELTFYCPNGTASGREKVVLDGVDLAPKEATTLYYSPNGYVNACFEHDFNWTVSFVYKNLSSIETLLKYVKFTGNEYEDFLKNGEKKSKGKELTLKLKGTLGGSDDAVFSYDGKTDNGELTFTVNGKENKRQLKMDSYDETNGRLVITELYANGEEVGKFDGTWEKGSYKGKFTNTAGKSIDFNFTSN